MADLLTAKEVKSYLGIDYDDTAVSAQLERMINTADRYLCGSVGDNYPRDDSRAKEAALIIISDLYENRGLQTLGGNTRRLVEDMILQIRLELRRKE